MTCSKCHKDKDPSDFYTASSDKVTKNAYCKSCFNKYCVDRLRKRKVKAVKLLGSKCQDCNMSYHPSVYDFHHIGGKDYSWTQLRLRKWSDVTAELSKCVLLCSNCHRIRHWDLKSSLI